MTVISLSLNPSCLPSWLTKASSPTSEHVARQGMEGRSILHRSYTIGLDGKGTINQLNQIYEDSKQENWDGYGAEPVRSSPP